MLNQASGNVGLWQFEFGICFVLRVYDFKFDTMDITAYSIDSYCIFPESE